MRFLFSFAEQFLIRINKESPPKKWKLPPLSFLEYIPYGKIKIAPKAQISLNLSKTYFEAAGYKFVKWLWRNFSLSPRINIQILKCRSRVKRACFACPRQSLQNSLKADKGLRKNMKLHFNRRAERNTVCCLSEQQK